MRKIPLIAISGQKRNGKNEIAYRLCKAFPDWDMRVASFAEPVKQLACDTFGFDMDFLEKWKVIDEPVPGMLKPMREVLTFIGDGFRKIDPDVWIRKAAERFNEPSVFADCRYPNEMKLVHDEGGVNILVVNPDRLNDDECDSERLVGALARAVIERKVEGSTKNLVFPGLVFNYDLPEYFSYIDFVAWNNGTLEDLHKKIDKMIVSALDFKWGMWNYDWGLEQPCPENYQR